MDLLQRETSVGAPLVGVHLIRAALSLESSRGTLATGRRVRVGPPPDLGLGEESGVRCPDLDPNGLLAFVEAGDKGGGDGAVEGAEEVGAG